MIGLVFFMFIIGMEVDINILSNRAQDAVVVSHTAITIQFFLGALLAYFLYKGYAPAQANFVPFALFMGIAISITAFPVLARIIQERNMTKTFVGTMAIACAAVDDITAWSILALVIAIVKSGDASKALITVVLGIVYIAFMIMLLRPFMARIGNKFDTKESLNKGVVALVFLVLLSSAFISEMIGIHALFGAFLAGAIMPQHIQFKRVFTEKIEDVAMVLLLPLFFVTTGLRTEIGSLNTPQLWIVCAIIITVAMVGKMGAVSLISRYLGMSWKNSLSLGALMNAKGLMELVVLNIAYDLGMLTIELFTMLVLMALFTTFMTGPLLNFIEKVFRKETDGKITAVSGAYNMLLSFGPPKMGKTLMLLAQFITGKNYSERNITALHITPQSDVTPGDALVYERESFAPIKSKAADLNIPINTHYLSSGSVEKEISKALRETNYQLLLVGGAKPLFNEKVLGGKIKNILEEAVCDVAVLSDKNFTKLESLLLIADPVNEPHIFDFGLMLAGNAKAALTVINANLHNQKPDGYDEIIQNFKNNHESPVMILEHRKLEESFLQRYDLILVSEDYWNNILENDETEIRNNFSYLIIHQAKKA